MLFKRKFFTIILLLLCLFNYSINHEHHHHHKNSKNNETFLESLIIKNIKGLPKLTQANIGAAIISSAPIPIFILIVIFNIKNVKILDIMSSFAAGALIGDVFLHNLHEITENNSELNINNNKLFSIFNDLLNKNELLICWGILSLFIFEKLINYYEHKNHNHNHNHKNENLHEHNHNHNHSNIVVSLVGDFIHNFTDGMAIGAGFNKNLKTGVSLALSIFFHEIPHEIGDFSYLLKQNMNITNAIISQMITSIGSFCGVYLSFSFGEKYSNKIISFASGAFLYLAINTIMGDLKNSKSIINNLLQGIAFIFGVYVLDALI